MGLFDSVLKSVGNSVKNSAANSIKQAAGNSLSRAAQTAASKAVNNAADSISKKVGQAISNKTKKFTYASLPNNVDELKSLPGADMKDEFAVASFVILALCMYPSNREAAIQMIDYLNGPEEVGARERQFINDRFMDGKDYIPKSYFKGATPDNNYTPDVPYTIEVTENPYSRESEGYVTLWLESGGADSPRFVKLRNKPSTGQWFVWDFEGLLAGIRQPVSTDKWA